jgi:hypothetical protein
LFDQLHVQCASRKYVEQAKKRILLANKRKTSKRAPWFDLDGEAPATLTAEKCIWIAVSINRLAGRNKTKQNKTKQKQLRAQG